MWRFVYIGFWLTVSGTAALFFLSRYEKIERLEMRVTGNIKTDHVDHVWFSPTNELVGAGRKETQLLVRVWSGSGALVRERAVSLPAQSETKPIFAVSGDASQAAWLDPAGVRVAKLNAPERESRTIAQSGRRVAISSLAFTGPDKLAPLYRDGELERDLANLSLPPTMKRKPSTAQHPEVVEFLNKLNELVRQTTTRGYFQAAE